MDAGAFLDGVYMLCFAAAMLALLPDPFVFDKNWNAHEYGGHSGLCGFWERPAWYHALKVRNWFSHFCSLTFVLFTMVLLAWGPIMKKMPTDTDALNILAGTAAASAVFAFYSHYFAGLVVSAALTWMVAIRYHVGLDDAVNWIRDGGTVIIFALIGLGLAYVLGYKLITYIVDALQFPAAAAFTISFTVPFYISGWHSYVTVGGVKGQARHSLWGPTVATITLTLFITALQLAYHRHNVLAPIGVNMKPRAVPSHRRRPCPCFSARYEHVPEAPMHETPPPPAPPCDDWSATRSAAS